MLMLYAGQYKNVKIYLIYLTLELFFLRINVCGSTFNTIRVLFFYAFSFIWFLVSLIESMDQKRCDLFLGKSSARVMS